MSGFTESLYGVEQGRLAGSVGSDDSVERSLLNLDAQILQNCSAFDSDGDVVDINHVVDHVLISLYLGVGHQVGTPHHQWSGSLRE